MGCGKGRNPAEGNEKHACHASSGNPHHLPLHNDVMGEAQRAGRSTRNQNAGAKGKHQPSQHPNREQFNGVPKQRSWQTTALRDTLVPSAENRHRLDSTACRTYNNDDETRPTTIPRDFRHTAHGSSSATSVANAILDSHVARGPKDQAANDDPSDNSNGSNTATTRGKTKGQQKAARTPAVKRRATGCTAFEAPSATE